MSNAYFKIPTPFNEPVNSFAAGSDSRKNLIAKYKEMLNDQIDIPMFINGQEVFTDKKVDIHPPHQLKTKIGQWSMGNIEHVMQAVDAALAAKSDWEDMAWYDRAAIFLKAAHLLTTKYRDEINAATMLAQSKNVFQAEVDAVAELADFWRFNAYYMSEIYAEQPRVNTVEAWNRMEYRALEGFIFAITPFNFTAIAGNLPSTPAMLGNTVVWKPADSQIYSAHVIMKILREAGLPDGVINLVFVDGPEAGDYIFKHRDFAGLHFTGSTSVFKYLWKEIGQNIDLYKSYPRIVGETGGKDYVVAHPTANAQQVVTGLSRAAFEFQGQKCSAASRAYIPKSLWPEVKAGIQTDVNSFKVGSPEDTTNFVNAVIDERAFDKIASYIDRIHASDDAQVIAGGTYDKSEGYFIQPTVVETSDPKFLTMCEEIFGPVLTIYVYEDNDFDAILDIVDDTSEYALTGSIFARPREVVNKVLKRLQHSAGNFYINDKPTGSIVGQQPFGGARGSGTNDKAGSVLNLYRWVSARTIKENFNAPTNYRYPFLKED